MSKIFSKLSGKGKENEGKKVKPANNISETNKNPDQTPSKQTYIFDKKQHNLNEFLSSFGGNKEKALLQVQEKLLQEMRLGRLPKDYRNGYLIEVNGFKIEVRGVISNGEPRIGTMYIP